MWRLPYCLARAFIRLRDYYSTERSFDHKKHRRVSLIASFEQGKWVAAACSPELILNTVSYWEKPLWRLVLEVMGGRHALISRELCDEL